MTLKNEQLNKRFIKFKDSFSDNSFKFGKYWEKEKITFNVNFQDGIYYSTGTRDYLPTIFNENFLDKELIFLDGKKFIKLGEKNLCTLKNKGSKHLLHTHHYFNEVKNYINNNDICIDVGSGSGLLQFFIHDKKNTVNILIDLPESLQSSIALCFTLFPNSNILLPNEINNEHFDIKNYDFIFLLPSQKHLIKNATVDFCINTQSFMEMDIGEVNDYIKYFNNVLKLDGHCFLSNRVLKRTYFYNYNFKDLSFKKVYLQKDKFYFSKDNYHMSSFINLLVQRKKGGNFSFNLFNYVFGIFNLKRWEFIFWIKFFMKKTILYPFKIIKSSIFRQS